MQLERLAARGFRNLAPFELRTDAQFVVLYGPNAQGKTNSLEAVHLLATLKPLRGHRTRNLVGWDHAEAAVSCRIRRGRAGQDFRVDLGPKGRSVRLDGRRANDLQEYFAGIRAISFQPVDAAIVAGEPALRRNWVDRAAFTARPEHLAVVRTYRRCLEQKAAALRMGSPDHAMLDALDEHLAHAGAMLAQRRVLVLGELQPHVQALHRDLASSEAEVTLRYATAAVGDTVEERRKALLDKFAGLRANELRRRMVLAGPQKDDVHVLLAGRSVRTFGSQGQVRTLVLTLKLAELVAARERGEVPLFLLDDVSSELDKARTRRLVGLLGDLGAQVFATTTAPEHMDSLDESLTARIEVRDGQLVGRGGVEVEVG